MNLPISKYVIVGSYPLNIRFSKDIDVICYQKDINIEVSGDAWIQHFEWEGKRIECLIADEQESLQRILENHTKNEPALIWELFAIKAGHINFPHRQWKKHIHDYHYLRNILGAVDRDILLDKELIDLIKLHKKCTQERLKIKTPKLKGVTKEEFFDDFVTKYYIHDNIHKCMSHKEKPMYEYMQEDLTKVECSKKLWDEFTHLERMQCVLEECYVIALERHIIPAQKTGRAGLVDFLAFEWALMRVCTTLCSGWFRAFAVDNYYEIMNQCDTNFVRKFTENIGKYEMEECAKL